MTAFGGSAKYYDLFYADKDTAAECAFVRKVIERHAPGARSLLDLGCGSGRHAAEFAKAGFAVTGVDISDGMLALARERVWKLPPDVRGRIDLAQSDVTSYMASRRYDAVVSLFHVIDYQVTDEAVLGLFRTARQALDPRGLFVFDFWYGPAVEAQRPERREKHVENDTWSVDRVASPVLHAERRVVDVHYTLTACDRRNGAGEDVSEVHAMRYFFRPELERFAGDAGFDIVEWGEWLTGKPPAANAWSCYAAARAR